MATPSDTLTGSQIPPRPWTLPQTSRVRWGSTAGAAAATQSMRWQRRGYSRWEKAASMPLWYPLAPSCGPYYPTGHRLIRVWLSSSHRHGCPATITMVVQQPTGLIIIFFLSYSMVPCSIPEMFGQAPPLRVGVRVDPPRAVAWRPRQRLLSGRGRLGCGRDSGVAHGALAGFWAYGRRNRAP
jgi:hypothetical protein